MNIIPKPGIGICTVELESETIEIPYRKQLVKTQAICPGCGKQLKAEKVIKIIRWRIKYKYHRLINFEKVKEQTNKELMKKTLICMNCAEKIAKL